MIRRGGVKDDMMGREGIQKVIGASKHLRNYGRFRAYTDTQEEPSDHEALPAFCPGCADGRAKAEARSKKDRSTSAKEARVADRIN